MLAGILALVILVVKLFPDTPLARSLHLGFVELPLRLAHRIERKHLILLVILLCSGQMLAVMGSAELALAYAADMSLYYDAMLTSALAAAATMAKSAWSACTVAIGRFVRGVSSARPRSRRKRAEISRCATPANDDDPVRFRLAQAA